MDLVGAAQSGDLTGPMVFSAGAIEKHVAKVKELSQRDFKTFLGIDIHDSNLGVVEREVRRICRSIRWPRPIRFDPASVPEERQNYACQHGASIRARETGGRRFNVGAGRPGVVSSASAGVPPRGLDGFPVPSPKGK
eukprot:2163128-Lingulodinium_polyedra.AAC.1